jgi:hypothetical protein
MFNQRATISAFSGSGIGIKPLKGIRGLEWYLSALEEQPCFGQRMEFESQKTPSYERFLQVFCIRFKPRMPPISGRVSLDD